ncbi:MAG: beta-propeller fold lactonase family protein [Candidatus Xenobiia bacterium LiM19]
MKRSFRNALFPLAIFLITVMASGCGGGSTDSSFYGGDGGGTAALGYSVSGTLKDTITDSPVEGAECTLLQTKGGGFIRDLMGIPKETVTAGAAITDQNGQYSLAGVPSGTYTLRFTKTGYVTLEVEALAVTQDTTGVDRTVIQISQWSQVAGSDAPYDASKDYVTVDASLPSKGDRPAVSGVSATITPSTGVRIGYFTDSTPPTINWNATATSSNGRIIFYGLTPGVQYTITFTLPGYIFPTLNVSSPSGGGIVQSYNIYATSPTPTLSPSPSPTPSSSPTPSPSPSPSPTQTGGGGGGGGTPSTLAITGFTPCTGLGGKTSVTISGTNFGTSKGTVKFNGVSVPDADVTWTGATSVTAIVPQNAATGKITVTTAGGSSVVSADDFYVGAPAITTFSSASGHSGDELTITGTGFGVNQDKSTVKFSKYPNTTITSSVTSWSTTRIVCTVPTGAATGNVTVKTEVGAGSKDFDVFYYGYVTEVEQTGYVVKIDTGTNDTAGSPIAGFNYPFDLAVTPDGGKVYVPNFGGTTASVIYTLDNSLLIPPITVGTHPQQVAMAPDGAKAYVSNASGNSVSVITTASNTVDFTIEDFDSPAGLAVSPDGQMLYVANNGDNTVWKVDTVDPTKKETLAVGTSPIGIVITPDGTKAYVANSGSNSVSVIDLSTFTVVKTYGQSDNIGTEPKLLAVTPDGSKVYVTNNGSDNVSVINTANYTDPATTIGVGDGPADLAVTPDGAYVYVCNSNGVPGVSISVIKTSDNSVTNAFTITHPFGIVFKP